METTLKTTPLNHWHRAHGANMANFGGFDMPLWYESGVKTEHLAVIESAGIFDTSHMACVMVSGKDALPLLQLCHTRDLTPLMDGRCVYGVILNDNGHVIDDAIVYRFTADHYMVCVNAGMGAEVAAHLTTSKRGGATRSAGDGSALAVVIEDLSEKLAKMDIQGKNSAKILSKVLADPDAVFEKMPYFSFKGYFSDESPYDSVVKLKNGTPVLISRSGYTGEFGFELFISPKAIVSLWEDTLMAGEAFGITACGLGSRDSLRAGSVLPLSHQDVGEWTFMNNPWMFALPLNTELPANNDGRLKMWDASLFTKDFIGKEALILSNETSYTLPFVGENLKKVTAGEESRVIDADGTDIGHVLTCATDMAIGWHEGQIFSMASPNLPESFKAKGISCGFIKVNRLLQNGEKVTLQENKRKIKVTITDDVRPDRTARKKISTFL